MNSRQLLVGIVLIASISLVLFILPRNETSEIKNGGALIHYASYSGWIIETSNHIVVFDYIETPPAYSGIQSDDLLHTIENGYIDKDFMQDRKVIVLTSHAHTDHYDPVIQEWENWNEDTQYYFGWEVEATENRLSLTDYRENVIEENYKIYTVNHPFTAVDNPEVAYLLEIDGLTIFHSGDLSVSDPEIRPEFKSNIDYLAEINNDVDFAFISMARGWYGNFTNGGDIYTMQTLNPKIVFPQHYPNSPINYELFAEEALEKGVDTIFGIAENRGDTWVFSQGDLLKIEQ